MRTPTIIAAATAMALGGASVATSTADSAPLAASTALVQQDVDNPNLHQVRSHWDRRRAWRSPGPRWHGHRFHRRDRWDWGPAVVGGILGLGLGAALTAPRAPAYGYAPHTRTFAYGGQWQAHVQWCQQRYRSYDVATDTFLSYDGNRYRCNSPYVAR
jgi:hypothetical protein